MKQCMERLYNGVIKENPTFVLMLGMCPTLAMTSSAINGFGMGIATMVVLAMSNLIISLLRKVIPDKVRIPAFIVIVATFVTIVGLLMKAYVPVLDKSLGIYIDLIVVNCIILGRAEAYASKNKPLSSLFDGIGMGLGFTFALTIIGFVRELLGNGSIFGVKAEDVFGISIAQALANLVSGIFPVGSKVGEFLAGEVGSFSPIMILVMAPGAFFILAILTAIQNKIKADMQAKGKDASKIQSGCNSDCMNCKDLGCKSRESLQTEANNELINEEKQVQQPEDIATTDNTENETEEIKEETKTEETKSEKLKKTDDSIEKPKRKSKKVSEVEPAEEQKEERAEKTTEKTKRAAKKSPIDEISEKTKLETKQTSEDGASVKQKRVTKKVSEKELSDKSKREAKVVSEDKESEPTKKIKKTEEASGTEQKKRVSRKTVKEDTTNE